MNPNFKKQLAQLYNEINQEIYSSGVQKQKIDIVDNKIIIFAQAKRAPLLSVLSERFNELTLTVDAALSIEFKRKLKEKFETLFHLKVISIFKDYDPFTQTSCTIIYLDQTIDEKQPNY
jgi:uncharacterized protein YbcI